MKPLKHETTGKVSPDQTREWDVESVETKKEKGKNNEKDNNKENSDESL